jgi:hypothetical protein
VRHEVSSDDLSPSVPEDRAAATPAVDLSDWSKEQLYMLERSRTHPPGDSDGGVRRQARRKKVVDSSFLHAKDRAILHTVCVQLLKTKTRHQMTRRFIEERLQNAATLGLQTGWGTELLSLFPMSFDKYIAVCEGLGIEVQQPVLYNCCKSCSHILAWVLLLLVLHPDPNCFLHVPCSLTVSAYVKVCLPTLFPCNHGVQHACLLASL